MAQQYLWPPSAAQISGTVPVSGTVTVANEITGTIASITNIVGGTIAINTGTLASITNVAAGTIAISTGTIATIASVTNVAGGTITISGTPTVQGGVLAFSGSTTSGTGVIAGSTDVSAFASLSVMVIITGAATVTFQASNDNTTFVSVSLQSIAGAGVPTTVASSNGIFDVPVTFRYFRVNVTAYSNGTASAFVVANSQASLNAPGLNSISVSNQVTVIPAGGTVGNVAGGTLAISTGTIASITNLATGTIAAVTSVTNVAAGTIAISTGTIASITNLAGGTVSTSVVVSSTAANTQVAGNGTVTTILAANASRKSFAVFNNSSGTCFLCLGTVATTQVFTVAIPPNGYYEQPNLFVFTGSVTAIWSSSVGSASITEFK